MWHFSIKELNCKPLLLFLTSWYDVPTTFVSRTSLLIHAAAMHLDVCKWFACIHVLSLGMLSFRWHMVKWLDVMQAVAMSVCIT